MCFIAVLERYGQRLAPACGLLGGFGLNEGALAATVSHDSHNIVVIGRSAEEMALAVNQVIQDEMARRRPAGYAICHMQRYIVLFDQAAN
ncbi:adenine deaminase C-terminal domain-containing protein [Escherichia coli]|uniref:adenine deaminase C-terminal domain-containing protein n=1 Tax=Escherichia coli TaxID=562 RepID=UPI003D80E1DC